MAKGKCHPSDRARSRRLAALLPARAGRRARVGGKWLAHALLIFVPTMLSVSLMGSGIQPTEVVAAVRNTSVEVVLPEGGRGLQLSCSGGSMVLPVDRVGGPPDLDFTDEGDARLTARRSPDRWRAVLVSVSSDMSGEVSDQFGALGNIRAPNGMIMKRIRNAGKPRQRSRVGRCGLWEAPIQYGGHVAGGMEFSSDGGCLQVEEWVLTGVRRQSEQVCSERRPGRLAGEFRDDLVGLAVKHLNDLGPDQLLGRDMEPVGVALDGVEQPGCWVGEFSQQGGG
jgi:hypothetical protein